MAVLKLSQLAPLTGSFDFVGAFGANLECRIAKEIIFVPIPNSEATSDYGGFGEDLLIFTETWNLTATIITVGGVSAETLVNNLRAIAKTAKQKLKLEIRTTSGTSAVITQYVMMKSMSFSVDAGKGTEYHVKLELLSVQIKPEELSEA